MTGESPRSPVIHVVGSPLPARAFAAPMVRWLRAHDIDARLWVGDHPPCPMARANLGVDYAPIDSELLGSPWRVLVRFIRLCREFRKAHPWAIHTHLTRNSTLPLLAAFLVGVPVRIYHNHGLAFRSKKGITRLAGALIERLNVALATHVLFASPSTAREAVAAGLLPEGTAVFLADGSDAGIDLETFPEEKTEGPARAAARDRFGFAPGAFVVGFVGRPVPHKGLGRLLEAWSDSVAARDGGRLLIVGSSPVESAALWGRPFPTSVTALEYQVDLLPFFAAVDVVVLPSAYEGFPNALLEAAAARRAVVTTRVPGSEDAVVDGETGLLVPPGDTHALREAIDRLAVDRSERERMGRAGRARAELLFSRDRVLASLVEFYCRAGLRIDEWKHPAG